MFFMSYFRPFVSLLKEESWIIVKVLFPNFASFSYKQLVGLFAYAYMYMATSTKQETINN